MYCYCVPNVNSTVTEQRSRPHYHPHLDKGTGSLFRGSYPNIHGYFLIDTLGIFLRFDAVYKVDSSCNRGCLVLMSMVSCSITARLDSDVVKT